MSRRALVLQHVSVNPPGIWGEALEAAGVELDVVRSDLDGPPRDHAGYDLIVSLGGPQSLLATEADPWLRDEARLIRDAVTSGVPFLGVCLGAQLLARALGGSSLRGDTFELGVVPVRVRRAATSDPLLGPLRPELLTYAYHRDTFTLPGGAVHLASSAAYANQAFRWGRLAYGLQFHLEPTLADIDRWLSLTPDADVEAAGGAAACLAAYACALPALRDAAAGIAQRWLAVIRRERHAVARARPRSRGPRLLDLRPQTS